MGTDLTVARPAPVVEWEGELNGARMLIKSGLLPQSLKSPEAALFVILTGRDLGLSPVQSLRSIHVIQGKIEVAADMQLGLFHRAGGRSQWVELTNETAVLKLAAPWLIEPHTESFTIADARQAKLGGDNWQKYPKAMLRSRAITAGLKSIGFDPTAGIYAPGEIGGVEVVETATAEVVAAEPKEPELIGTGESLEEQVTEAEDTAHVELIGLMPLLNRVQQAYVREKLGEGVSPAEMLPVVRQQAAKRQTAATS